ncbi:MAG: hypothetical protein AAF845_07765 [Bacteroidota bacterium]
MTRLALLGLAFLTASASAQTDLAQADLGARADALFGEMVEASRASLAGHTSLIASGPEGTLYYRIDDDGGAECRAVPSNTAATPFVESICFFTGAFTWSDDGTDDDGLDASADSVWIRADTWDGTEVDVVGMYTADDPEGMEQVEVWVERAPRVTRRVLVSGEFEPGAPLDIELRYDDVRTEAGVTFPRQIALRIAGIRAMFEGLLAEESLTLRDVLALGQARFKAEPSEDGAFALRMIKAAIADEPLVMGFPIREVVLDAPIPEGLFEDGP